MIFKKLILKNFKSHIDSTIEFNKGTTIIIGENGAGKSSIFEGINFALYKKYNTKSLNDLINTQANSMTITLYFLVSGQEYKVTRTRSKSKSTAKLSAKQNDDFNLIISGDKEVNSYIEDLLEIDADLFLNAIYIKQGEIDSLVTQKASERKKNISKLLRLENLEDAYKYMANVITNYELKRNQTHSLINNISQENKEELLQEQNNLEKQLDIKNKELAFLQGEIKNIKEKIAEQNVFSVKYQQLNNKKTQLETEANSLSNNLNDLKQQIQILKDSEQELLSLENDISNIDAVQKLSGYLDNKNESLVRISSYEKAISDNLNNISFVDNIAHIYHKDNILSDDCFLTESVIELGKIVHDDYKETDKAVFDIKKQTEQILVDIAKLETIISDNQQSLKELINIQGVCPICQSILDDEHKTKLINNYNNIIEDNSSKLEKRQKELQILQEEEHSLNRMLIEKQDFFTKIENASIVTQLIDKDIRAKKQFELALNDINKKIDNCISILGVKEEDVNILYNNLLSKKQQYQEIKFKLENKQDIQDKYNSIQAKYDNIISDLNKVISDIANLGFDMNLLQQYQTKQSELQNQYYPLVKEVGQIENDIKYNKNQINNIDNQIKQNKENQEKIQKLDEFILFLKDIRELYSKDGLQRDIRLTFKPEIERYTQDFFTKFDFDYSNLKLSDDYDIIITGPSGESDITMASGGEKIAIALALRLGIAQAVTANTIETILLDEPTTYLDVVRKQEFIDIIKNISLTPQMIIITHDSELENAANNIISVEKKNGKSVIA